METLELVNTNVSATVDPGRGADVLSLVHRRSGVDVLFSSPWRERADAVRDGQRPSTFDPVASWLEQYRGGWQTLCPNGGEPRVVHGAPVAFHGEASVVPWTVDLAATDHARLHVELFSVPVCISRSIRLDGMTVRCTDTVANLSTTPLEFDYVSHPALGGTFLAGDCEIDTGARRFTCDPGSTATIFEPGSEHRWPEARSRTGESVDLRRVSAPGTSREVFGWLEDFSAFWASVTNTSLGLTVRIEWDGEHLPYAWLWQELNATESFPWYRRGRAVAIEPASMQTSGAFRRSALRLGAEASVDLSVSVGFEDRSV